MQFTNNIFRNREA